MNATDLVMTLAVEHWRVLRMYERAISQGPPDQHMKHAAQLRYANSRLESLLDQAGMKLKNYDGQPYSPNLPVVVVNGDDFSTDENLQIEQTLEPTVLEQGEVRAMGKVVLRSVESS